MNKEQEYISLIKQIENLVEVETNKIANISNIIAALMSSIKIFWLGCYFIDGNELVLGPFQGPVACTRIKKGKGVCGSVWENNEGVIVPNVHEFVGHIACSSDSNSELVVPIHNRNGAVIGVLDADSKDYDYFNEIDKKYFVQIAKIIGKKYE